MCLGWTVFVLVCTWPDAKAHGCASCDRFATDLICRCGGEKLQPQQLSFGNVCPRPTLVTLCQARHFYWPLCANRGHMDWQNSEPLPAFCLPEGIVDEKNLLPFGIRVVRDCSERSCNYVSSDIQWWCRAGVLVPYSAALIVALKLNCQRRRKNGPVCCHTVNEWTSEWMNQAYIHMLQSYSYVTMLARISFGHYNCSPREANISLQPEGHTI